MASCSLTTDSPCFGRLCGLGSSRLEAAAATTQLSLSASLGAFKTANFDAEILCFPSMQVMKKIQKVAMIRPAKKRQEISGPGPKKCPDEFLEKKAFEIDANASVEGVIETKAEAGLPGQLDRSGGKLDKSTNVLLSPVHLYNAKLVASVKEKKVRKRKRKLPKKVRDEEGLGEGNEDEPEEPKMKRRLKDGKSIHKKEFPQKVPGTSFKICANCGTVAEKTKAKKCQNCKKFFFNHWAKRCRIPPCPTCHYSRKAKTRERIPAQCERCGSLLPPSSLDQVQEYDSIHESRFNFYMEIHQEQSSVTERCGEGPGEGDRCLLRGDPRLDSSLPVNVSSLQPAAICSEHGTAMSQDSDSSSPNGVDEFEENNHPPLSQRDNRAATNGNKDDALISARALGGEGGVDRQRLVSVKTSRHVSLDFNDLEECTIREDLEGEGSGIGKRSAYFLPEINTVMTSPIIKSSAELCRSLDAHSEYHPKDPSDESDELVHFSKEQSKICSHANSGGSSNLERRVGVKVVEREGRGGGATASSEEDNADEDKKDVEAVLESKGESWAKQGILLSPMSFQRSNNSHTSFQMQPQSASHHSPLSSHSPHKTLIPTLLDSMLSPPLSGTTTGGKFLPVCAPCTSPPIMAPSGSPFLTPWTSPVMSPSIVSFGAHSVMMSTSIYPVTSTVTSSNPAGTCAVVPPSVFSILDPSTSLAKNPPSVVMPPSVPSVIALAPSSGLSVTTSSSPVVPLVSSTILATACTSTNSTGTYSTPNLPLPKVSSTQAKHALTGSQTMLAATDCYNYRSPSNAVCSDATAGLALDVRKKSHPSSSLSVSDRNSLASALLKWQSCKVLPLTSEMESKPATLKRCQPPSLVSITPCDEYLSDAPYSLPHSPRVTIVTPPPLQNIKECPTGEKCQSISRSVISGISLIKSSSGSLPNCSSLQSTKSCLPPPLLSVSLSKSLAGSSMDATTATRLTSSRTTAVNVISSISAHPRTSKFANVASSNALASSPLLPVQNSPASEKTPCRAANATLRDMHQQNIPGGEGRQMMGDGESMGGEGITSLVLPSSSFQRLDLALSSNSPNSSNKIRVSLLKDSSEPGQDRIHSSPSPSLSPLFPSSSPLFPLSSPLFPSSTRLTTNFSDFPRYMSSVAVGALSSSSGCSASSSTKPHITTTSVWNSGTGGLLGPVPPGNIAVLPLSATVAPLVGYATPTSKLQKFAGSPKLAVISSAESVASKSSRAIRNQSGSNANGIGVIRNVVVSAQPAAEDGLSIPDALSSRNSSSFPNEDLDSKLEIASSNTCSNSQQLMSRSRPCPVLDLEPKVDTITIERLASNVHMRINSALSSGVSKSSLEEAHYSKNTVTLPLPLVPTPLALPLVPTSLALPLVPTSLALPLVPTSLALPLVPTSQVTGGASRTTGNYRRILPNLSKYPSAFPNISNIPTSHPTLSLTTLTSSSSFSHIRTPGLVTVHVCSSIPATLSLSSIMTPSISQAGSGGRPWGGGGAPPTYPDLGGNLVAKKLPHISSYTTSGGISSYPTIIKHRSVVAGGGNVMVTPLSPSLLPAVRTVAQIVTNTMGAKEKPLVEVDGLMKDLIGKISSRTRSRDSVKMEDVHKESDTQPLFSDDSLNSSHESGEQVTEAGGSSAHGKNKSTTDGTVKKGVYNEGGVEDGGSEEEEEEEEGEDEGAGGKGGNGRDDSSKDKKSKRGGKRKEGSDTALYTIKLKDCYMHHMMWEKYRVVLIVPTQPKGDIARKVAEGPSSSGSGPGSGSGATSENTTPTSERRRRRKVRHEPLQDADEVPLGLDDPTAVESSPSTSSAHVRSPCFSMYELRLKHFRHMTNNAVYAYTYKHQIKSLRTPAHWVQVLRRMGGVQEHGHTFRLVDILRVKEMCQHFSVLSSWPNNLESLARNEFSKTRILIDLSQFSPEQLMESDRLDVIPACPYLGPPTPPPPETKPKRTYTKKKPPKEEKKKKRKYVRSKNLYKPHKKDKLDSDQPNDPDNQSHDTHVIPGYHKTTEDFVSDQPTQDDTLIKRKAVTEHWANGEEEEEENGGEEEEEEDTPPPSKRLPPPLIRHDTSSPTTSGDRPQHHIGLKKKVCPECSAPIARKCKKCPSCGKRFGVFTFGRRVCTICRRINLARMTRCFQCSHPLYNAPKATPDVFNVTDMFMEQSRLYSRTGSVFGAKKKRNTHPFFSGSDSFKPTSKFSSSVNCSSSHMLSSSSTWYSMMSGHSRQIKAKTLTFGRPKLTLNPPPLCSRKSKTIVTSESDSADGPHETEEVLHNDVDDLKLSKPGDDGVDVSERYTAGDSREQSILHLSAGKGDIGKGPIMMKSKTTGYQYGRIPWGEADITCLVDDKGSVKVCLQELCSKVLHTHGKGDVFDMVKNLNLPLEHGDLSLLKKLQALGLHSNRSPMCRLIASEELWTLLDALEEAVPEEVYQHLDQMSTYSTPLLSPPEFGVLGGDGCCEGEEEVGGGVCLPPAETRVVASPTMALQSPSLALQSPGLALQSPGLTLQSPGLPPSGTAAMVKEDEHGFETTLHEVECSDGQSVSILRAFNGEQFTCVTEFWRKYFPEVNRNHLTSALKRLSLETLVPTGQQATLLRSAGVISVRGAAGRLMKFGNMEKLLEDFGIPLQIGKPTDKISSKKTHPNSASNGGHVTRPRLALRRPTMCGYKTMANYTSMSQVEAQVPPGKVLVTEEDAVYANCMRNVLGAIDHNDLQTLLLDVQQQLLSCSTGLGSGSSDMEAEINGIQQLIYSRRLLCGVLADEISYLTLSNHGYMAESIRMDRMEKQFLKDIQDLLNTYDISLIL